MTYYIIGISLIVLLLGTIGVLSYFYHQTKILLQNERNVMKEYITKSTTYKKEIGNKGSEIQHLKEKELRSRAMTNVLLGLFGKDIVTELFAFTVSNADYEVAQSIKDEDMNSIKINAERSLKDHLKQIKPGFKYTVTFPPQGTKVYPEGERLYG